MSTPETKLPAGTAIGAVSLTVADLERVAEFYEQAIGLEAIERGTGLARLGAGGAPLVELVAEPDAAPRPPGTTGLFHLAILVPDRPALAASLRRVASAGSHFTGASDHLVSEALYLSDPEGNGIEIYRDRPREDWRIQNGEIEMASLPLDLQSLEAEPGAADPDRMAAATTIGHVHLNVADIPASEAFYAGPLGFDVTVRGYPGALFVAAGDYHHHVGLNTWAGEGAPPPPPGVRGLRHFEIALPSGDDEDAVGARLEQAGFRPESGADGTRVADPSGNGIVLRSGG